MIKGAGGGTSSLKFCPITNTPFVASIGYVIGGSGQLQFSRYAIAGRRKTLGGQGDMGRSTVTSDSDSGQWVVYSSGRKANDEVKVSLGRT